MLFLNQGDIYCMGKKKKKQTTKTNQAKKQTLQFTAVLKPLK